MEEFFCKDGQGNCLFGHIGYVREGDAVYFAWYIYTVEYTLSPQWSLSSVRHSPFLDFWHFNWQRVQRELNDGDIQELKCFFKARAMGSAVSKLKALRF